MIDGHPRARIRIFLFLAIAVLSLPKAAKPACPASLGWSDLYYTPGYQDDRAYSVVVTPTQQAIVVGYHGDYQHYSVVGGDWLLRKYDVDGTVLWTRTAGGGDEDIAEDVALASNGDFVAVGYTNGGSWLTRRYDSNGTMLWEKPVPGGWYEGAYAVAIDSKGCAVVVGHYDWHWRMIKYDALGNQLWDVIYTSPANYLDVAMDVAIDANDRIYAVGTQSIIRGSTVYEVWTMRVYDSAGNFLWSVGRDPSDSVSTDYSVVKTTPDGGIILGGDGYALIRYSSAGVTLWSVPQSGWDSTYDLVVNPNGSMAVVGAGWSNPPSVRMLDATGVPLWSMSSPAYSPGAFYSLAFTAQGDLVCAGMANTTGFTRGDDWLVQKVNAPPACLSISSAVAPSSVVVGQSAELTLTITNTGGHGVKELSATVWATTGAGLVECVREATPPGATTLCVGAATTYRWSFSATGKGTVIFLFSAAGKDEQTDLPVSMGSSKSLGILGLAALAAALSVSPALPAVGEQVTVRLTVTNTGDVAAFSVVPAAAVTVGSSLVQSLGGPVPTYSAIINSKGAATFAWTFTAVGSGTVAWCASATGTSSGPGVTVFASSCRSVGVYATAARLSAAVSFDRLEIREGVETCIRLTVTNCGTGVASGVTPTLGSTGNGRVRTVTGPDPSIAVSLAPGSGVTFTWRVAGSVAGVTAISAGVAGVDTVSGAPISANAEGSLSILPGTGMLGVGEMVIAPNVLDSTVAGQEIAIYVRGDPGRAATIRIYDELGRRVVTFPVVLDVLGLATVRCGVETSEGGRLKPGIYYALAAGGGTKDRKAFVVR